MPLTPLELTKHASGKRCETRLDSRIVGNISGAHDRRRDHPIFGRFACDDFPPMHACVTVFLGCGFAAKYREGGGNFSVPLQWMLGLRRLKQDAIWLELPACDGDRAADAQCIVNFQRQLRAHGLARCYCLLYQDPASQEQDLAAMRCIGISQRELRARLAGPNVLLNLAYSIHPPFLLEFERRIFCDLDPSEIFYWMTKLDLGQSITTSSGRLD